MKDFEPLLYTYAKQFTRTFNAYPTPWGNIYPNKETAKIPPEPFGFAYLDEETAAKSLGISKDKLNYYFDIGQIEAYYLFTPWTSKGKQNTMKIYSMNELQQFERVSQQS